jgi:hypothetical protein
MSSSTDPLEIAERLLLERGVGLPSASVARAGARSQRRQPLSRSELAASWDACVGSAAPSASPHASDAARSGAESSLIAAPSVRIGARKKRRLAPLEAVGATFNGDSSAEAQAEDGSSAAVQPPFVSCDVVSSLFEAHTATRPDATTPQPLHVQTMGSTSLPSLSAAPQKAPSPPLVQLQSDSHSSSAELRLERVDEDIGIPEHSAADIYRQSPSQTLLSQNELPESINVKDTAPPVSEEKSALAVPLQPLAVSLPEDSPLARGSDAQRSSSAAASPKANTATVDPVDENARTAANARSEAAPVNLPQSAPFFSTGRGVAVVPTERALLRARSLLCSDDGDVAPRNPTLQPVGASTAPSLAARVTLLASSSSFFSSGRGVALVPSSAALQRARSLFSHDDQKENSESVQMKPSRDDKLTPPVLPLFSTGRGAAVVPSASALARAQSFLASDDEPLAPPPPSHTPSAPMFSTGRGTKIAPSTAALARARSLLDAHDVSTAAPTTGPRAGPQRAASLPVVTPAVGSSSAALFSTGRGAVVQPSEEALKRARSVMSGDDDSFPAPQTREQASATRVRVVPTIALPSAPPKKRFSGFKRPQRSSMTGLTPGTAARGSRAAPPVVLANLTRAVPRRTLSSAIIACGSACEEHLPLEPTVDSECLFSFSDIEHLFLSPSASMAAISPANSVRVVFDDDGAPRLPRDGVRAVLPVDRDPATVRSVVRAHALLLRRGADAHVFTPTWTASAFRLIVARAAAVVRQAAAISSARGRPFDHPHALSKWLSWQRVMVRLCVRAQRASDGACCSITRILARDAPAAAHAVYEVAGIHAGAARNSWPFVELTDGHVTIGGLICDARIANLVSSGRIHPGSKIRVATSEIVTESGTPGTTAPASTRGRSNLPAGYIPAEPCAALESPWNDRWAAVGWASLSASPPPSAWDCAADNPAHLSSGAPFLTLRANSVRPAAWNARLGLARRPYFLVRVSSLVDDGGPAPAIQALIMRRFAPQFLVNTPDGRLAMSAAEAAVAGAEHARISHEALQEKIATLSKEHDQALSTLVRRARTARARTASARATGTVRAAPLAIYAASQDDVDASRCFSQGASQADGILGREGGEEAAVARLEALHARAISAVGCQGINDGDGEEFKITPFVGMCVVCVSAGNWAATTGARAGHEGLGLPAAAAVAPVSANLTLWRVSPEDQTDYAEGSIYTITNLAVGDCTHESDSTEASWAFGVRDVSDSTHGAGTLPKRAPVRLSNTRETVFRSITGSDSRRASRDDVFSLLAKAAGGAGLEPSRAETAPADSCSLPSLIAAALCYSPRARVLLGHAQSVSFSTAYCVSLSQTLLSRVSWTNEASARAASITAADTPSQNTARTRRRRGAVSAEGENILPSPSLRGPSGAMADAALSPSPGQRMHPMSLWRLLSTDAPSTARLSFPAGSISSTAAGICAVGGPPKPTSESSIDIVCVVLRVSAARAAASARVSRGPPFVAWTASVTDESGAVGVVSFSTTLATRAALTGLEWKEAPDVKLSASLGASAGSHATLTPGSLVTLRDVSYLYWSAHERVHRLRWVESTSIEVVRRDSSLSRGSDGDSVGRLRRWLSEAIAPQAPPPLLGSLSVLVAATLSSSSAIEEFRDLEGCSNGWEYAERLRATLVSGRPLPPPLVFSPLSSLKFRGGPPQAPSALVVAAASVPFRPPARS